MKEIIIISINALFIENFVLSKFLGICPFLGVSKKLKTAFGMGGAVIFVMTLASGITWLINKFLLEKFDLIFLQTLTFILIIAALVQLVETVLKKAMPPLYRALGIYLPLITTNCAVLGSCLINVEEGYTFPEALVFGLMAGAGFTLALILFAGVRERLEKCDIPQCFKGFPISLISAALISLAFLGFQGLFSNVF